uniref:Uncharacterized protein n=1 Tax=Glossina pallidipes TaxID=7398 RepID=A0A1A9ZJY8_GLOPL
MRWCLVVMDSYSKWIRVVEIDNNITDEAIVVIHRHTVQKQFFLRFGLPKLLVSGLDLALCPLFAGSHRINRCDQFLQAHVKKYREPASFVTNTRRQPSSTNNPQTAVLDTTATKISDVMHLQMHIHIEVLSDLTANACIAAIKPSRPRFGNPNK